MTKRIRLRRAKSAVSLEPDFRLIGYMIPHSESATHRMQARSHWKWHQRNPGQPCQQPDIPQLSEGMGFWERLRA
jgi:hypothetical protein